MVVIPPQGLQSWLYDAGSFVNRLQQQQMQPYVVILKQDWQYPEEDERLLLEQAPRQYVFIREILIKHADLQLMFARTIIPKATLTGAERKLQYLGTRTLGSVLFAYPDIERSPIEVLPFSLPQYTKRSLWGRQSLFYFQNKHLLLKEVLLPDFEDLYAK